jgi:hypothetical protein
MRIESSVDKTKMKESTGMMSDGGTANVQFYHFRRGIVAQKNTSQLGIFFSATVGGIENRFSRELNI